MQSVNELSDLRTSFKTNWSCLAVISSTHPKLPLQNNLSGVNSSYLQRNNKLYQKILIFVPFASEYMWLHNNETKRI